MFQSYPKWMGSHRISLHQEKLSSLLETELLNLKLNELQTEGNELETKGKELETEDH